MIEMRIVFECKAGRSEGVEDWMGIPGVAWLQVLISLA